MIQSSKPLRDLPTSTDPSKSISINSKTRDRSGSDLSTSVISNDSSIFDTVTMSDASSIPSDTEDHDIEYKYHPPRISSKTYMAQTTETIEEDPDEDSENGDQVVADTGHPGVQVTKASSSSSGSITPPRPHLAKRSSYDDQPIEMKRHHAPHGSSVANGNISAESSNATSTISASPHTTTATSLTPGKREKSFFHLPKLNRSQSHSALPAEAKSHSFKDSIKNVFSSANGSSAGISKTPPDTRPPSSASGTPLIAADIPSSEPSPQHPPVTQSTAPSPSTDGPRRVASVGRNMILSRPALPLRHDQTQQPDVGTDHKAVQGRGSRAVSDPPPAPGIVRAKTLKECGITNRGKQAGKGATSTVTRCSTKGIVMALKSFHKPSAKDTDFKRRIEYEFEIAHSLDHPNVVKTMELVWDEGKHNWVETMEWCGGGDLFSIIKMGHMTGLEKNCCFKQLVRGVAYMHSMGIAHRDIKPENLLLNEEGQLKITDFGVSEVVVQDGGHKRCRGMAGSEPYMAPEVHTREEYDGFPLDVWGCGVVYITLAFGGIMWLKAAEGDTGYDRFIASIRKSEERKARKEAELAEEAKVGGPKEEEDGDKGSLKSDTDDAVSRVSSVLSFKHVSPVGTPPNGLTIPGSPKPKSGDPKSTTSTPQRNRSVKGASAVKPADMVQSPLPIGKATGAKGDIPKITPHYLPFEMLLPQQRRLIYRILDPNPETRITAAEILKDPWFKEIQCCSFDPDELVRVQSGVFDASKMGSGRKKATMPVKHKHPNHLINNKAKK